MARRTRAGDSRNEQSRVAEQRPRLKNRYTGMLDIPESVKKDAASRGMTLQWVVEAVLGDEGLGKVQPRMINGWTCVPAERYPEMVPPLIPGKKPEEIIRRGGQILMEKPTKEVKQDRADLRADNLEELKQIKYADIKNDPTMPKFVIGDEVGIENAVTERQRGAAFQDE